MQEWCKTMISLPAGLRQAYEMVDVCLAHSHCILWSGLNSRLNVIDQSR
uniref:Uncharacterized protein n=1 Tax=Aegilops tauschii subsp. strangulata TaxID=200361 RepID=A0A453K467_AEGTS